MIKTFCLLSCAVAPLQAHSIDNGDVSGVDIQTSAFNAGGVTGGPGLVNGNVSNGLLGH